MKQYDFVCYSVDFGGHMQWESDYYPYGGEIAVVNLTSNNRKFTGKKRDTETDFDYSHHRMLNSSLARWTGTDPVMGDLSQPQSLNRYAYVDNNPVNYIDPQGSFLVAP